MTESQRIVDAFIQAAQERPDDFRIDSFRVEDTKSGLSFWLGVTPISYSIYQPFSMSLNPVQSIRLWYYVKKLKAWKAEQLLAYKSAREA